VTNSLPLRLNQVCTPIWRAGPWVGVAVGRWPLGDAVALAVPLGEGEAGLDAPAVVVGAGPSEPDEGVPQPTASKLTPTIINMGRRFMGPPSSCPYRPTLRRPANRRLTATSPFAHIAARPERQG
jgi:hypothetical protein